MIADTVQLIYLHDISSIVPRKNLPFATTYPTRELLDSWQKAADKSRLSLASWIVEMVEAARNVKADDFRPDLLQEIEELKSRCLRLERELELEKLASEKAKTEAYRLQHEAFSEIDRDGYQEYDAALVRLLQAGGRVDQAYILKALGIDPRDGEAVKLVRNQIEELRRFGLIKENRGGWIWTK